MKQIFTLAAMCLLSMTKSFGQTSFFENFEGDTKASLTTSGWSFSSTVDVNTGSNVNGQNSLRFDIGNSATTGNATTESVVLLDQFANIAFKYRTNALNPTATRSINFGYYTGPSFSTFTALGTITLNNSTSTLTLTSSTNITVTPNTTIKFSLNFNGNNDQASDLYIDDISISTRANSPLPIIINSFTGSVSNNKANLAWSVAENETGDRFEIEKSADGKNFSTEATVFTTEKIGSENYAYKSLQDLGNNAAYRLKIVNKNNTVSYSRIVYLKKEGLANGSFAVLQNPIRSSLSFTFEAEESGVASVQIYNTAGVKVHGFKSNLQKGMNTVVEAINDQLKTGTYVLEVTCGTQRKATKIYKQ